jgi:hypothetical protein
MEDEERRHGCRRRWPGWKRKLEMLAFNLVKKTRPAIERRRGSLQSSEDKAAYNRAKIKRPTEYTENTELQETEIDAAGITKREME